MKSETWAIIVDDRMPGVMWPFKDLRILTHFLWYQISYLNCLDCLIMEIQVMTSLSLYNMHVKIMFVYAESLRTH